MSVFVVAIAASLLYCSTPIGAAPHHIGIAQFAVHPALDAYRAGFLAAIEEAGFTIGDDLIISSQNANGDPVRVQEIVSAFILEDVSLIYAIATPPLVTAADLTTTTPIVFGAVRDPLATQLVAELDRPGRNATGASHWLPGGAHARVVRDLIPDVDRIGVLYNPAEINSRGQVNETRVWANENGIDLVERPVSAASQLEEAVDSLVGQVSALLIPTDNTVVSGLDTVLAAAARNHIPVFGSDFGSVERGAVAAYGSDDFELGKRAGEIALAILVEGADPANIPVAVPIAPLLAVNLAVAETVGLVIPEDLLGQAERVYGVGTP